MLWMLLFFIIANIHNHNPSAKCTYFFLHTWHNHYFSMMPVIGLLGEWEEINLIIYELHRQDQVEMLRIEKQMIRFIWVNGVRKKCVEFKSKWLDSFEWMVCVIQKIWSLLQKRCKKNKYLGNLWDSSTFNNICCGYLSAAHL